MPVRNGEAFIRDAIRSILWQTYSNWELLILDDGSEDSTCENVLPFLDDERVRWYPDRTQLGLAARLNHGIRISKGEFIARMDADDVSFPRRFELQLAALLGNPATDLVGGNMVEIDASNRCIGDRVFPSQVVRSVVRGVGLPHPTWMGRRDWFLANPYGIPELKLAEDQELLLRALSGSSALCLEDYVLGYRLHPRSFLRGSLARFNHLRAKVRYADSPVDCVFAFAWFLGGVSIDVKRRLSSVFRWHECPRSASLRSRREWAMVEQQL